MTKNETREHEGGPSPEEVAAARRQAGLSQEQAAQLVHLKSHTRWSEYERGVRTMDEARFELFKIKTGQHTDFPPRRNDVTA